MQVEFYFTAPLDPSLIDHHFNPKENIEGYFNTRARKLVFRGLLRSQLTDNKKGE